MVRIEEGKCIGCGQCVRDCFARQLRLVEGKAVFLDRGCIGCGHCMAICPMDAVTMDGGRREELLPLPHGMPRLDPEEYLFFMKGRRTIRQFTEAPLSEEQLHTMLEVVRYSPTGANRQDVLVTVIQEQLPRFRELILDALCRRAEGADTPEASPKDKVYAGLWKKLHRDFHGPHHRDRLFFDAPAVLVLSAAFPLNGAIAAAHLETMIYALGLGMLYSGFTVMAAVGSEEVRTFLGLPAGHEPVACLVVGHPKVDYLRTVGRKPTNVVRM